MATKEKELKLNVENNPPKLIVEFFDEQKNIKDINCYSNDGGNWKKSNLKFVSNDLIITYLTDCVKRLQEIFIKIKDEFK